jgi:hypothetical protein
MGQQITRTAAKFEALIDAFEFVGFGQPGEHEAYLRTETGEVLWHSEFGDDEGPLPDDIEDSQKYIPIPHKNDLGLGKPLVLKFAGEFLPDALDNVREIFRRRGAYARFKDLLEHRGMLRQWHEYEATAQKKALREWCEEHGIELDG